MPAYHFGVYISRSKCVTFDTSIRSVLGISEHSALYCAMTRDLWQLCGETFGQNSGRMLQKKHRSRNGMTKYLGSIAIPFLDSCYFLDQQYLYVRKSGRKTAQHFQPERVATIKEYCANNLHDSIRRAPPLSLDKRKYLFLDTKKTSLYPTLYQRDTFHDSSS